jgi:hypothetical protein
MFILLTGSSGVLLSLLPCTYKMSFLSFVPSPMGEAKGGECSDLH